MNLIGTPDQIDWSLANPLTWEDLTSKMSKADADKKASKQLSGMTFGSAPNPSDLVALSNAYQGLNEKGEAIQEGDPYWKLATGQEAYTNAILNNSAQAAAVRDIQYNNPALLAGAEGRANMGNFGGKEAIEQAKANIGNYVNSQGFTDQYHTDVAAGLGGQNNLWNLGGRTLPDGSLRPESEEYLKSGIFEAPDGTASSYQPYSGPYAPTHNPDKYSLPKNSSKGPEGYTYDTTTQTITHPETGAQYDPNTGMVDDGVGKPQIDPPPVSWTAPPSDEATTPPPTPPLGGDTTTQGGGNWWDGYGSIDDVLAAHQKTNEGGFGGSFEDFFKFMMMMNMMGGMGGGGYGGSQYGYGGLHPGGVMQAYDPLERLQGSLDWFNKSFGSGTQGGTTTNVA